MCRAVKIRAENRLGRPEEVTFENSFRHTPVCQMTHKDTRRIYSSNDFLDVLPMPHCTLSLVFRNRQALPTVGTIEAPIIRIHINLREDPDVDTSHEQGRAHGINAIRKKKHLWTTHRPAVGEIQLRLHLVSLEGC